HVFTDADGRRFADETGYEVHDRLRALLTYLPRNPNRPRLPSWAVFDEAARCAGPLNGLLGTPNDYAWSPDNSAEIDRGWILAADGPADLAVRMGVDPGVLTGTLERYNASARAGRDEAFGRSADTLVPLDLGRLYAIETWPRIAGTTGGPRHDERARVLRPDRARALRRRGGQPGLGAPDRARRRAHRRHGVRPDRGDRGGMPGRGVTAPARRVAVVTGGAGAIGGSVAAALTAAGHQVLILDRTGDVPVDLADEQ